MSNVALYDPADITVPNRVTEYLLSVNTPDYTGNVLINPNLSSVSGVEQKYWKEDSGNVVEMNQSEKDSIDAFLIAKTIKDKNFRVYKYDSINRMQTETWYATDNGDETYSDKVEETTFHYKNGVNVLLYKITKFFYADGTEESSVRYDYFNNGPKEIIEKKEI